MSDQKRDQNTHEMVTSAIPSALLRILSTLPKAVIAFSGGIDSRFLCLAARLSGCQILAIHVRGPHIPASATLYATRWANDNKIPIAYADYNPLARTEIRFNRHGRCYFCKKGMLAKIKETASLHGCQNWPVCDGSQQDDQQGFRPGRVALAEAGVISPLALAGIGKRQIRDIGAKIGLSDCSQKSRPCLLTRFAYDLPIYKAQLEQVEACEAALGKLFEDSDCADFRLRLAKSP